MNTTPDNSPTEQVTVQVEVGIAEAVPGWPRRRPLNEPIAKVWWKLSCPIEKVSNAFLHRLIPLWEKTIEGHSLQYDLQVAYQASDGFFEVPKQAASRFYKVLKEAFSSLGFKIIQESRTEDDGTRLVCVLASEVTPERLEWLWPNRLVMGEVNVFVGLPDAGKSAVALDVAAKITTGEDFYDQQNPCGRPRKVVILATEDSFTTTIVPRLIAAEARLENVILAKAVEIKGSAKHAERMLALDTDIESISARIAEDREIALLIFDPLAGYLGRAKKNYEEDMRPILESLKQVANEQKICVLVLEHLNKNSHQSAIHRIAGSQAMSAVPRAVWLLAREPKEESEDDAIQSESGIEDDDVNQNPRRLMICIKLNLTSEKEKQGLAFMIASKDIDLNDGKPPVRMPVIEWLGKTTQQADNVVQGVRKKKPGPEATQLKKAMDFIKDEMKADSQQPSERILDKLRGMGISFRTATRAREKLGIEAFKKGSSWWWRWKSTHVVASPF